MSDELENEPQSTLVDLPPEDPAPSEGDPPANPDEEFQLPEKFKSNQALLDAYNNLEAKIGSMTRAPEEYELNVPDGVEIKPEMLQRLKDAGYTNDQAQEFVDIYTQDVIPGMANMSRELELTKLGNELGTNVEKATQEAQRVLEWARRQNDGQDLLKNHGSTASGLLYLRREMEHRINQGRLDDVLGGHGSAASQGGLMTQAEIERIVMDPRYNVDMAWTSVQQEKIQKAMLAEVESAG